MELKKALEKLREGKKIRRPSWNNSAYLKLEDSWIRNNKNDLVEFSSITSLESDDWEVVEGKSLSDKITAFFNNLPLTAEGGIIWSRTQVRDALDKRIKEAVRELIEEIEKAEEDFADLDWITKGQAIEIIKRKFGEKYENLDSHGINVGGKPMTPSAPKTSGNVTSVTHDTNFDDFVNELKLNFCSDNVVGAEMNENIINELAEKYRKEEAEA